MTGGKIVYICINLQINNSNDIIFIITVMVVNTGREHFKSVPVTKGLLHKRRTQIYFYLISFGILLFILGLVSSVKLVTISFHVFLIK